MAETNRFNIFLVCTPGLEAELLSEVRAAGFQGAKAAAGGVTFVGRWQEVWRANLELRGTGRVIAEVDTFHVQHLSQLDKRARLVPWKRILRANVPVRVEAQCTKSKIYHSGAAAERVASAITAERGAPISKDAEICVRVRLDHDICSIGIDTSGELLHKRGIKEAVGKAPMRETMAALILRRCRYDGRETIIDPMCGSGTFVIEAAEIAAGLKPGRSRAFAFEKLATFDASAWAAMKARPPVTIDASLKFHGSDRDAGAIRMSRANAARAGVDHMTMYEVMDVSDVRLPDAAPGLVIVNPPYGERIGDKRTVMSLYREFGTVMKAHFKGWRVAIVTTDSTLAAATGLTFEKLGPAISHGGLRVNVYVTGRVG